MCRVPLHLIGFWDTIIVWDAIIVWDKAHTLPLVPCDAIVVWDKAHSPDAQKTETPNKPVVHPSMVQTVPGKLLEQTEDGRKKSVTAKRLDFYLQSPLLTNIKKQTRQSRVGDGSASEQRQEIISQHGIVL